MASIPNDTHHVIRMIISAAHHLCHTTDAEMIVRDADELVQMLGGLELALPVVLESGIRCELQGGYVEQTALVTTGNWRDVLTVLKEDKMLPVDVRVRLTLFAHRDELSGEELMDLESIADEWF